ncbi:MAG: 16S rRNA (uracil(1498)-N(3))-methyltransferase [Puniceicoccales bacterium]|jgi:16S rRNA (uracil1498-N3)-methyltransferase|nr:16S rRNA (uracil(1498)-N(3))-methyltransferase [Puniceicoccales bacterium]
MAAAFRTYYPFPVSADATELTLPPSESAHLIRSLRARPGEPIEAFNGTGQSWHGIVLSTTAALTMRIDSRKLHSPKTPALVLAQVLPKYGVMDEIVRASVEIGVAEIHPLFSERCETHLDDPKIAARMKRWNSIAIEACKQSGNPFPPRIACPEPLKTWLLRPMKNTLRMAGSLESTAKPLSSIPTSPAAPGAVGWEKLLLLIGPEGDFSPNEYALIRQQGTLPVRFGENTLRVPTAALYALAALDQLRQRISG